MKHKKLKDWHIKLINNFSKYEAQRLTWKEIATEVDASWTAVETFVRRNKNLFEKEVFANKVEVFMKDVDEFLEKKVSSKIPKILILDIETTPNKAFTWKIWQENINPVNGQLIQDWMILSYAVKDMFDDRCRGAILSPKEIQEEDDSRLLQMLWDELESADIVIAHNGKKFDIKKINARFLKHGMKPTSPYQLIDTLEIAKSSFALSSNKLDYIAEFLGHPRKIKVDFQLWVDCVNGKQDALDKMLEYNFKDILVLEDVYISLRPFAKSHVNLALYIGDDIQRCPCCGEKDLEIVGNYYTQVSVFDAKRCTSCGHISRSRKSSLTKEQKQSLVLSVPR